MKFKLISALEKCFLDESIEQKTEYTKGSCLKNELFHFGICFQEDVFAAEWDWNTYMYLKVDSPIAEYVRVTRVEPVPVQLAANNSADDDYLRLTPGLYPDVMQPLEPNNRVIAAANLRSLMVEVDPKGEVEAGTYPITFVFTEEAKNKAVYEVTFELEIIDAFLPEQELKFTQWFHCDGLKNYYRTETFSDEHFRIIENFAKTAVRYGINMLLTPVFTSPLDTAIGGERDTMQLVGVIKENGKYSFDFSLLDRWVDMCDRIGIKYFEISHFFTQWGAKAAPKIMATVDGEYKRIFGWETDSCGEEYKEFLNNFIPAFLEFMKSKNGADKRCWFHISDEPNEQHLEGYLAAKSIVAPLLEGYPIIDALSSYEFYSSGAVEHPIPSILHIEPFIENNVPDLWCYYCVGEGHDVSNRFISMPLYRTRTIGTQFYKFNIDGFLHWGYNFYNNQLSYASVNPFMTTDAEYFAPAGDAFSVYPGPDGSAWESIRLLAFYDAIQDLGALKLCEKLKGRDFVMELMEEGIEPIKFSNYPKGIEYFHNLREKLNNAIKNAI